jgi:uncharacterized membrane protein
MRHSIVRLVRANIFYIIVSEVIFLGLVFLLGWVRSYAPDIHSFEMFMDEGFLAAIMRSPHFPPNDMWLSGYAINYYYYAHFTIAMLAKLLGQPPSIAFNTGICIFFGLTAVNLFAITCNIVSWARHLRERNDGASRRRLGLRFFKRQQSATAVQKNDAGSDQPGIVLPPLASAIPYGLLTILMGLILGNLASTQQWWQQHDDLSPFYWFNTTRIIDRTINEFPAFSFLLSCFHAHVLTLAFTILAIGLAFSLLLEYGGDGKGRGLHIFGSGWRLPFTLGITALVLGGLFTMNGWDFPTYLAMALVCIALQQWIAYQSRFCLELVLDVFTAGAALAALSFFMYAPFYLNFISPSLGIGIVGPADRSPFRDAVLIYGMFTFIFVTLLVANLLRPRHLVQPVSATIHPPTPGPDELSQVTSASKPDRISKNAMNYFRVDQDERSGLSTVDSPVTVPVRQQAVAASQAILNQPVSADQGLASESEYSGDEPAEENVEEYSTAGMLSAKNSRPPRFPWLDMRVISAVFIIAAALLILFIMKNGLTFIVAGSIAALGAIAVLYHVHDRPRAFTLLLGAVAFGLVALTEVVFLKDVFAASDPRMNTVFKFYFQAWALLSITSSAGLYFIVESFRSVAITSRLNLWLQRGSQALWSALLLLLLLAGAVYPLVGTYQRTNHFMHRTNSLDGLTYMQSYDPGDYAAIQWLNSRVQGDPVIVEAFDPQGGDYTDYGRISAFTGLPTLMGWAGHEYQWRVNWLNRDYNAADFYGRGVDINTIYTNTHSSVVLGLLAHYSVEYLYVGPLEQATYPGVDLHRFGSFMRIVYAANGVTIYQVPQNS